MKTINADFLKEYRPENDGYTTIEEMHKVEANCIKECNLNDIKSKEGYKGLKEVRDQVVGFYSGCMDNAETREIEFGYMDAMQSVTAVIDNLIYA